MIVNNDIGLEFINIILTELFKQFLYIFFNL